MDTFVSKYVAIQQEYIERAYLAPIRLNLFAMCFGSLPLTHVYTISIVGHVIYFLSPLELILLPDFEGEGMGGDFWVGMISLVMGDGKEK